MRVTDQGVIMKIQVADCTVELVRGDITTSEVDAIVNAANSALAGGGGVDGAIHRAGGSAIMQETSRLYPDGCPTGEAVISTAGNLPCQFVIHTVGPVWRGGLRGEPDLLKSAYRSSLQLAVDHHCQSVAFPAISTGVYGYPLDLAARHSLTAIADFLREHEAPQLVQIVLFDAGAFGAFSHALEQIAEIVKGW